MTLLPGDSQRRPVYFANRASRALVNIRAARYPVKQSLRAPCLSVVYVVGGVLDLLQTAIN